MKKIASASLREGQKFTRPVFIDEESIFIPENVAVKGKDIGLLASLGIEEVFTNGELVTSATKEELAAVDAPFRMAIDAASDVSSVIVRLVEQMRVIFTAIGAHKAVNIRLLWSVTDNLQQLIKANPYKTLACALSENIATQEIARDSVSITIISAIIGGKLSFSTEKIQELVVASLLHDAGMLRLPQDIVKKTGALSGAEVEVIKTHTLYSFNIMKNELLYPDSVCQIALQHHERWDGTGYPQRLAGKQINKGALVVSVADAFVAMLTDKSYRNSMTGYQAIKTLVAETASYFSPNVLQTFVKIMGIYPIGSAVLLNDGSTALIISVNDGAPLRPVIQIIAGKNGTATENGNTIDLLTNKTLFITRAVDIKSFQKQPAP
jgi:HD-GYP domain-containing protein (c-di-GMP phosphodiesterase class II)